MINDFRTVAFLNIIYKRCHELNQSAIIMFTGPTGSGKSYGAMRMGYLMDPPTNEDHSDGFNSQRICFDVESFVKLITETEEPGTVLMLDEAGVAYGSRNWQSYNNKIMSIMTQTARSKNQVWLWTTPEFKFIDSHGRHLVHFTAQCGKIYREEGVHLVRIRQVVKNFKGELWEVPLWWDHGGVTGKIMEVPFKKPPVWLVNQYEAKKIMWQRNLYGSLSSDAATKKEEFRKEENDFAKNVDLKDIYTLYCIKGLSMQNIAQVTGLKTHNVSKHLSALAKLNGVRKLRKGSPIVAPRY